MSDIPSDSPQTTNSPLASLGTYLREEREKKGFTLEQVASATRINLKVLQSLELDRFDDLPAKPFVRGFILSYARFVGIDGKAILLKWDPYLDSKMAGREDKPTGLSGYAFDRREGGEQSRTFLSVIMAVMVIGGGGALMIFKPVGRHSKHSKIEQLKASAPSETPSTVPSDSSAPGGSLPLAVAVSPSPEAEALPDAVASPVVSQAATPSVSPSAAVEAPAPSASPLEAVQVVLSPSPVPSPSGSVSSVAETQNPQDPLNSGVGLDRSKVKQRVILKAAADVWVRYRSDERPLMKFILRKGKVLVLRAEKGLLLQVSNPKALSANVNFGKDRAFTDVRPSGQVASGALWVFSEAKDKTVLLEANPLVSEKPLPSTPDPDAQDEAEAFSQ